MVSCSLACRVCPQGVKTMDKGLGETLNMLGRDEFELQGEYSRLVSFLNRTLKERDLIFGITRTDEGKLCLTIYGVGTNSSGK